LTRRIPRFASQSVGHPATTFKFSAPKKLISTGGLMPGTFNDDIPFTFEAKDVHVTDLKELEKVFAEIDFAVSELKKSWQKKASGK
jgi:hypothetical protein